MSINDFSNKIKSIARIDNPTILCLLVLILVGFSSFGLGRLSSVNNGKNDVKLENKEDISVKGEIGQRGEAPNISIPEQKEKLYIASKNGKLYYSLNCSGAKRISEKNALWFSNSSDAEKAGYSLSASCK